MKKIIDTKST